MIKTRYLTIVPALIVAISASSMLTGQENEKPKNKRGAAAIERARQTVRMLDDIYKGGVVVITENYVNDKDTIPAGTAFKQLFAAAEKKGWHKVRLLDATGEPYNDENEPEDAFEKKAVKQLVAGKPWVEAIEVRKGTKHLRVATAVPVVFEKCVMCHDNYADVPAGQAIGALSYTIPINGELVSESTKK